MTLPRLDASSHQPPLQSKALDTSQMGSLTQQPQQMLQMQATTWKGRRLGPAAARLMPLAESTIYPATRHKEPYFPLELLHHFNMSLSTLSLDGEVPDHQEAFLKPLPVEQVAEWLQITQPWADKGGTADFPAPDQPSWNTRYTDASFVWQCIESYLTFNGTKSDDWITIVPDFSNWEGFNNEHKWLHRRCEAHTEWQAEAYYRYCLPGTPDLDPSKPHVNCFVGDNVPLKEDQLSTSEVQSILWLASNTAARTVYLHHNIIPVTIISCSGKQLRIVQGITRLKEKSVEIRKSKILDFEKGITRGKDPNWTNFLTVLSWFIGEPVGDTQAA